MSMSVPLRSENEILSSWGEYSTPLVSICCITYNHSKFIKDALEGFLMQKTTFPFEIVIFDDASTDDTQQIIEEYIGKYPNLFVPFLQKENLWQGKGISGTFTIAFPNARGKYIAWCEGDDYWTSPNKLQKQVDFLEANEDYAICFHNVNILNEKSPNHTILKNNNMLETTTIDDLIKGDNYIATTSTVIRTSLIYELPEWFNSVAFKDYALFLIAASYGKIRYIDEVMGIYRIHSGGIYSYLTNSAEGLVRAYQQHYDFWQVIKYSGMICSSKLSKPTLRAIENVIHNATKSKQINIFLKYNYLLVKHSHGKRWRSFVKNIINYWRSNSILLRIYRYYKVYN